MLVPLQWFRPSPFWGIAKVAVIATSLMTTGVLIMAGGLDGTGRVPSAWQNWLIIIGITMVISGVLTASFGFVYVVSLDRSTLILYDRGLGWQCEKSQVKRFIPWQELQSIELQDAKLLITSEEQEPLLIDEKFLGMSNGQLVEHIREFQRKILLGVVP